MEPAKRANHHDEETLCPIFVGTNYIMCLKLITRSFRDRPGIWPHSPENRSSDEGFSGGSLLSRVIEREWARYRNTPFHLILSFIVFLSSAFDFASSSNPSHRAPHSTITLSLQPIAETSIANHYYSHKLILALTRGHLLYTPIHFFSRYQIFILVSQKQMITTDIINIYINIFIFFFFFKEFITDIYISPHR